MGIFNGMDEVPSLPNGAPAFPKSLLARGEAVCGFCVRRECHVEHPCPYFTQGVSHRNGSVVTEEGKVPLHVDEAGVTGSPGFWGVLHHPKEDNKFMQCTTGGGRGPFDDLITDPVRSRGLTLAEVGDEGGERGPICDDFLHVGM